MVCSSAPDCGIPMRYDIYDWLREKYESGTGKFAQTAPVT